MRALQIAILILALAGCAAGPQNEISAAHQHCDEQLLDPHIAPIRGKLVLRNESVSVFHLANREFPTDEERYALAAYFRIRESCVQQLMKIAYRHEPHNAHFFSAAFSRVDQVLARLYNGGLTYGEANKQIAEINSGAVSHYEQSSKEQAAIDAYRRMEMLRAGAALLNSNTTNSSNALHGECRFNPIANAYQQCFHVSADGQCFHFGGPC